LKINPTDSLFHSSHLKRCERRGKGGGKKKKRGKKKMRGKCVEISCNISILKGGGKKG